MNHRICAVLIPVFLLVFSQNGKAHGNLLANQHLSSQNIDEVPGIERRVHLQKEQAIGKVKNKIASTIYFAVKGSPTWVQIAVENVIINLIK